MYLAIQSKIQNHSNSFQVTTKRQTLSYKIDYYVVYTKICFKTNNPNSPGLLGLEVCGSGDENWSGSMFRSLCLIVLRADPLAPIRT